MSYKDYSANYRQEIRKNQLDELFQKKRQLLLGQIQPEKMEEEHFQVEKNQLFSKERLKAMAKMSQSQSGILTLRKGQIQDNLLKFLAASYTNTQEQYYSAYTLSNLYFSSSKIHESLLDKVNALLEQNLSMKIVQVIFNLLQNVLTDDASIRGKLINDYNFINTIIRLWNIHENPTIKYISSLVSITFRMLVNNSQPNPSFLKLRQYLFRVVKIDFKPQLSQMIKKLSLSICTIASLFPKETAGMLVNGQIVERLIQLLELMRSKRFAKIILDILAVIIDHISYSQFTKLSTKIFFFLFLNSFDFSQKTCFSPRELKIQAYKLMYDAMEKDKLTIKDVINKNYFKSIGDQFQASDDIQILRILTYIFVHIYLNCDQPQLKVQIEYDLYRVRQVCKNQYQIIAHIHQCEYFFKNKQQSI